MRRAWSQREYARACELREQGVTLVKIANLLGRKFSSVQTKLSGPALRTYVVPKLDVPPTLLEQRERLEAARDRRTFTQTFFGDPPPGYSALDRRVTR